MAFVETAVALHRIGKGVKGALHAMGEGADPRDVVTTAISDVVKANPAGVKRVVDPIADSAPKVADAARRLPDAARRLHGSISKLQFGRNPKP